MNEDYFNFLCQVRIRYSELLIEFGLYLIETRMFNNPEEFLELLLPPKDEISEILNQAWKKKKKNKRKKSSKKCSKKYGIKNLHKKFWEFFYLFFGFFLI